MKKHVFENPSLGPEIRLLIRKVPQIGSILLSLKEVFIG